MKVREKLTGEGISHEPWQNELPVEMVSCFSDEVEQAALVQSRMPWPKSTLVQRQAMSFDLHPKLGASFSMLPIHNFCAHRLASIGHEMVRTAITAVHRRDPSTYTTVWELGDGRKILRDREAGEEGGYDDSSHFDSGGGRNPEVEKKTRGSRVDRSRETRGTGSWWGEGR